MRKVNDSKEMVVFDLELVPQGPDPENGATNTHASHKTAHKHRRQECTTWRHGRNTQDSVFGPVLESSVEDNVKIVGPRAGMMTGRVSGSINTEMIVDSDRHE